MGFKEFQFYVLFTLVDDLERFLGSNDIYKVIYDFRSKLICVSLPIYRIKVTGDTVVLLDISLYLYLFILTDVYFYMHGCSVEHC